MLFKTLSVFAEVGSGGGGGGNVINGQYPPAQTGYNGQRNPSGTPGGRRNDQRRRVRGTTQGNARPNRQGMNPARYGPMM